MARARDILKISNFKRFGGRADERTSGRGATRAVGDDG